MFKLDENYYLRKCYFQRNQVPTQTVMKKKLTDPLANVYFKDMSPKLKVLAGLQPVLRGAGNDWFVPPSDILKGEVSLKPINKEYLTKLRYTGIDDLGERLVRIYLNSLEKQKEEAIQENDRDRKNAVKISCNKQWIDSSNEAAKRNTNKIREALHQFEMLFATSITKMESMLFDAAIKAVEDIREEVYIHMKSYYKKVLKKQATILYAKYQNLIEKEKTKRKRKFIKDIDKNRKKALTTVHDINVEKHRAIEKLRHFLECQNLACQLYVAIKERRACEREIKDRIAQHSKKIKTITVDTDLTDLEISLAKDREKRRYELNKIWQKKISDAMENPTCESIIQMDTEEEDHSISKLEPKPFVIYGDFIDNEHQIEDLETNDIPLFMINKHYIYANCDNLEHFSTKLRDYIQGRKGNDADVIDDFDYSFSMPVKYTSTEQLLELKLESSLMQVLQNEVSNINKVSTDCCICKVKHCFCSPLQFSKYSFLELNAPPNNQTHHSKNVPEGKKLESRKAELSHERNPNIINYADYVTPKRCKCAKRAKKHLQENIPPYMIKTSPFESVKIPNYEPCSIDELRRLVAKYRGVRPVKEPEKTESKTREIGVQYDDQEYEDLCNCYSYDEIDKLYREIMKGSKMFDMELNKDQFEVVGGSLSPTYLTKSSKTFATEQAFELKDLLDSCLDLQEIFKTTDCNL